LAALLGCIGFGVFLGWKKLLPEKIIANSGRIITIAIMILLITMGLKIGLDKQTMNNLGMYGLQAFLFAFITIFFSLGFVAFLEKLFASELVIVSEEQMEVMTDSHPNPYRMTFKIIGAFFLGIALGLVFIPTWVNDILPSLTNGALYFTLFAIGIDLGHNKQIWKQFMQLGRFVFLVPLGVSLGSVIAGMLVGKFLGWTVWEGGAVGAGFGWYSLSGVLISEIHSVALGTISFLSNVIREILTIVITPFLVGRVGKLTLIAPGGATTMDTTLPIIAALGPPGIAIIAFINGFVLSSLVPILVPLLLS